MLACAPGAWMARVSPNSLTKESPVLRFTLGLVCLSLTILFFGCGSTEKANQFDDFQAQGVAPTENEQPLVDLLDQALKNPKGLPVPNVSSERAVQRTQYTFDDGSTYTIYSTDNGDETHVACGSSSCCSVTVYADGSTSATVCNTLRRA